jgi:hypothetical protein
MPSLIVPRFYSFKVESTLEENWGEQAINPQDIGCYPETWIFCALCIAVSILLQQNEAPTSAYS